MSIKDKLLKSFLQEEIYKIKKEMRKEIAEAFKNQLHEKDEIIKSKDNLIAELIKENQTLKLNVSLKNDLKQDLSEKIYPSNMID